MSQYAFMLGCSILSWVGHVGTFGWQIPVLFPWENKPVYRARTRFLCCAAAEKSMLVLFGRIKLSIKYLLGNKNK